MIPFYICTIKNKLQRDFSSEVALKKITNLVFISTFISGFEFDVLDKKFYINYNWDKKNKKESNINFISNCFIKNKYYSKLFFSKVFKSSCFNNDDNKFLFDDFNSFREINLGYNTIFSLLLKDPLSVTLQTSSIGKGFSGTIKRYNFKRGPMSHGSKSHRIPGSLGAGTTPGRVFPGKKMAGRLGFDNKTLKNVKLHSFDLVNNCIKIYGSIPGKINNIVNVYF